MGRRMLTYAQYQEAAHRLWGWLEEYRGGSNAGDVGHFLFAYIEEGKTLAWLKWDIAGRQGEMPREFGPEPMEPIEPGQPSEPQQEPGRFPVPDGPVDLTSWSRRGIYLSGLVLDSAWHGKEEAFLSKVGSVFGHRATTRINLLGAEWGPDDQMPFVRTDDWRWDLYRLDPAWVRRLRATVELCNRFGIVPLLTLLELYSWSFRKKVPFDQALQWPTYNVNGVRWQSRNREEDDRTLTGLAHDPWLMWFVGQVCQILEGLVWVMEPGNEFPEKPAHLAVAQRVKGATEGAVRVCVNRNEETPGQYQNMDVGEGLVDMISHHGWKTMSFLGRDFSPAPEEQQKPRNHARPWTFREFFDNRYHNQQSAGIEFNRVVMDSDGCRASDDPVQTYDYPKLGEVMRFCVGKGCSILHQSRGKMGPNRGRLETVEWGYAEEMARM